MRPRVRTNELAFLFGLFALAHAARLPGLPIAQVLGDSLGPWWVAYRGALSTTPHAPPYGWGLAATYAPLLAVSGSLWTAITGLFALHKRLEFYLSHLAGQPLFEPTGYQWLILLINYRPSALILS